MRKNEKGFTLLEVCVSLILFAIMLESIWGFFSTIYINYIRFNEQVKISSEATTVEDFIVQEIRGADKVRIKTTTPGEQIEVTYKGSTSNVEVKDKSLERIQYMIEIPNPTGGGYKEKECEIILTPISPTDEKKGKYQLSYSVKSIGGVAVTTNNTIVSEMIENIKVTRYKDSDLVEFTCTLHKINETQNRLKLTKKFTESLEYKEHY